MNNVIVQPQVIAVVQVMSSGSLLQVIQNIANVVAVALQGPMGPAGTGDKSYESDFSNQSSVTVTHNLGKFPSVTVIDSAGDECEGNVDHLSTNQLTVTFSASFSGSIICN